MDGGLLNPVNLPPRNPFARWKTRVEAEHFLTLLAVQSKRLRTLNSREEQRLEDDYCQLTTEGRRNFTAKCMEDFSSYLASKM